MKKWIIVLIAIVVLITVVFILRYKEDAWNKNDQGLWVKHGNPSETNEEALDQERLTFEASKLYNKKRLEGMEFNSQCLGVIEDYVVDIVHVPRTDEDDLAKNQCEAYTNGTLNHFIEMDKYGNVFRII